MAYIPCSTGTTAHTQTYTVTSNGTKDMGEEHEYRYVNSNVYIPPTITTYSVPVYSPNTTSHTFYAGAGKISIVYFDWANRRDAGWSAAGSIGVSGAKSYWIFGTGQGTSGTSAFKAIYGAVCIGNGANITVSWSGLGQNGGSTTAHRMDLN